MNDLSAEELQSLEKDLKQLEQEDPAVAAAATTLANITQSIVAAARPEIRRPSFQEVYIRLAGLMSGRSTCVRLQVGCVITSEDFRKVLSVGYNGNASGLPNKCDSEEPGKCGCLHAEENAIINCDAPRSMRKIVFCTNLPCKMCAKRLVNLGNVQRVYYALDYRLKEGLDVLSSAGIPFEQLAVKW